MAKGKAIWDTIKGVWNYAPKAIQPSTYAPQFAKNAGYATNRALVGKMGAKGVRNLKAGGAVALGLGSLIGDSGPEEDETMQRAMNQLRYGADMTDEQLQEAQASGQAFRDTGAIGENGLSEADARAYIAQNADQRGTAEKIGGGVLNALSFIPGAGQAVGLLGGMEYDRRLGKARNLNLENIVGKLRGDANEGKIRRNMEGTMGKFMTEGLLDNEFGRGKVRGSGGIKPAIDEMAQAEESAALKQYEAIKAKDGVFAAISSPYAAKAGRRFISTFKKLLAVTRTTWRHCFLGLDLPMKKLLLATTETRRQTPPATRSLPKKPSRSSRPHSRPLPRHPPRLPLKLRIRLALVKSTLSQPRTPKKSGTLRQLSPRRKDSTDRVLSLLSNRLT